MCLLRALRRNTCTCQRGYSEEKLCIRMTSRTSGMNETGECEKVISSTIYKTEDNLVSADQVIY